MRPGDLTAVLGVGVDTLRNDLAAVLTQLQTPEEGRASESNTEAGTVGRTFPQTFSFQMGSGSG